MSVFVNVKDFGAKGDGTTDDRAAIQATIDSLPTTGGTVYLPPRTYRITGNVVLGNAISGEYGAPSKRNGIHLLGSGMGRGYDTMGEIDGISFDGATRLLYDPDDPDYGDVVKFNGPVEGCGIENMVLDGNYKAGTLIHSQRSFHQYVGNILGLRWKAPSGTFPHYALMIHAGNDYHGASGGGGVTQHLYENLFFTDPYSSEGSDGLASSVSIGATMPDGTPGNCNQLTFVRCTFDRSNNNYSQGLYLGWCDHIQFVGCHFWMNGAQGSTGIAIRVDPQTGYEGAPSNIVFIGTSTSGGISAADNWNNQYYPALIFHPYYSADSQPVPPKSANNGPDLPPGLVYGMTDNQLALGYRFDQVCTANVPDWVEEEDPIPDHGTIPAGDVKSHVMVLVQGERTNRIVNEIEVPRSVGSSGVFELTVLGNTTSYDGILFRPGGIFGKGFAIDTGYEVVLNHYRAVKLVFVASLGYWFFPDAKIRAIPP